MNLYRLAKSGKQTAKYSEKNDAMSLKVRRYKSEKRNSYIRLLDNEDLW